MSITEGSDTTTTFTAEGKLWELASKVGSFELLFDSDDMSTPDCLPWVLTFTSHGATHSFSGQDLDQLVTWALDFDAGRVDINGRPIGGERGE